MEAAVLGPQQAVPPPLAASTPKRSGAARRKTLCDITNLGRRLPPAAAAEEERDGSRCADAAEEIARLAKENADLVRLLEERDQIIELSGAEVQKQRLANWELARANSQMLAELNLGRNRLKALQHELACSRAALKAKTSELEEAKKAMKLRDRQPQQKTAATGTAHHFGCDRAAQVKDGGAADPEPGSDASRASSARRPGNASRKRMLRSRSLGPGASLKLAAPKEKEATQRRKSMRTPDPSERRDDLFELEDVQLAIGGCKIDPESAPGSGRSEASAQFQRRSSLGRPLRQARDRVNSYKEMPVNVKLRRS
ncbi:hypothetical protein ACP70R_019205 [Stipagrostis hirtigluma subsp. patula]